MKTSDATKAGEKCTRCSAPTARDLKNRGFVRHKIYNNKCKKVVYGRGEKD